MTFELLLPLLFLTVNKRFSRGRVDQPRNTVLEPDKRTGDSVWPRPGVRVEKKGAKKNIRGHYVSIPLFRCFARQTIRVEGGNFVQTPSAFVKDSGSLLFAALCPSREKYTESLTRGSSLENILLCRFIMSTLNSLLFLLSFFHGLSFPFFVSFFLPFFL